MKKSIIHLIAVVLVISAMAVMLIVNQPAVKPELSGADRIMQRVSAAVDGLGYELIALEELKVPVVYTDSEGNRIVYNRYLCTDPKLIQDGDASFFTNVFDPSTADSTQDAWVNGAKALLCEKDGRSYLLWYPNENTILMFDYDPAVVSFEDIMRMAEGCG